MFFRKGFAGAGVVVVSDFAALLNFKKGFAVACGVVDSGCAVVFFRKGFDDGAVGVDWNESGSLRRNGLAFASAGCPNWMLFFEGSKRPGWTAFANGFGVVVELPLG